MATGRRDQRLHIRVAADNPVQKHNIRRRDIPLLLRKVDDVVLNSIPISHAFCQARCRFHVGR